MKEKNGQLLSIERRRRFRFLTLKNAGWLLLALLLLFVAVSLYYEYRTPDEGDSLYEQRMKNQPGQTTT